MSGCGCFPTELYLQNREQTRRSWFGDSLVMGRPRVGRKPTWGTNKGLVELIHRGWDGSREPWMPGVKNKVAERRWEESGCKDWRGGIWTKVAVGRGRKAWFGERISEWWWREWERQGSASQTSSKQWEMVLPFNLLYNKCMRWETGGAACGKGWGQVVRSIAQKAQFSSCHRHLAMYMQTIFFVRNVVGSCYESIVCKSWASRREAEHAVLNTFVMTILENNYYWQVFSSLWGRQAFATLVPFYSWLIS